MRWRCVLPWASTALVLLALPFGPTVSVCRADLLNIDFNPAGPATTDAFGDLSYTRSTGELQSVAYSLSLSGDSLIPYSVNGDGVIPFDYGTTTIDLFVNPSGGFVASGTGVTIDGGIDFDNDGTDDATGVLLQGTIVDFGAAPAGPPTWAANGLFVVTGGALTDPVPLSNGGTLAALYHVGDTAGFIVFVESVSSGVLGDFASDFADPGGVKDNVDAVVPEPATLMLCLLGSATAAGAGWFRRRRSGA